MCTKGFFASASRHASVPGDASTATSTGSGGRLRNAMPRANARASGKQYVQNTAEGSRTKMRQRMRVSCHSGCWRWVVRLKRVMLFAQLPPGQFDKHVLERGVVGGKAGQRAPGFLEMREQQRQRLVQLLHRQRQSVAAMLDGMHARHGAYGRVFHRPITGELDHVGAAKGLDESTRRP